MLQRYSFDNFHKVEEAIGRIKRGYMHHPISSSPQESSRFKSWHRMFLTNPPVTTVTLQGPRFNGSTSTDHEVDILICPEGVTRGSQSRALQDDTQRSASSSNSTKDLCSGTRRGGKVSGEGRETWFHELFVVCEDMRG